MASLAGWLLTAPIWLIGIVIYGGMLLATWTGWKLRASGRRPSDAARTPSEEGYVVSSVMGLLALLVGFTFALAIDRYDARRKLVMDEANAIGTTYLRTQLLAEPYRTRLSSLLRDYTDNRVALALSSPGELQDRQLAASNRLLAQLWNETVAAFPSMASRPLSSAYIDAMNTMLDMDSSRQQARRSHVPLEVFLMLVIYQFIAAGVLGYVFLGRRGRVTVAMLLVLFGGSLILVIDIDRPTSGGITEDQRPMIALREMIHAQPPASFDRPAAPAQRGATTQ